MKKLSDTWWACRSDAILAVFENLPAIILALDEVQSCSQSGCVASEASGLKHQILKFEFLMCLVVLKDLLSKCRTISDYLQREDIDIVTALQVVDTTVTTLKSMRSEATFKKFFDEASKLADEMEIEITESRPRKVSRRLDDNHDNEHLILGIEEKFRATFFYEVLDIIMISEFESRFNKESR